MKIDLSSSPIRKPVGNLRFGDTFLYENDHLCVVIYFPLYELKKQFMPENCDVSVLDLVNNRLYGMPANKKVTPVETKVVNV